MDQYTHEVRAEYWKKIIQACGQRPAGQSAKSWMNENGIREQSYYHWQRRFRKQAYEEMKGNASVHAVAEKTELTFVEIPCHTSAVKVKFFAPRQIQRRLFAALVTLIRKVFRPRHEWF